MNEKPRQSAGSMIRDGQTIYLRPVPDSSWLAELFPELVSTPKAVSFSELKLRAAVEGAGESGWRPPASISAYLRREWFDEQLPRMNARSARELREVLRRAAEDIPGEDADEDELENFEWDGSAGPARTLVQHGKMGCLRPAVIDSTSFIL